MKDYFEWDSSYSVHIEELDMQHQKLIQMINQFHESIQHSIDNNSIKSIILNMKQYALIHFDREETYMKKYEYPGIADHVAVHEKFLKKIEEVEQKIKIENHNIAVEIVEYLKHWLNDHILIEDKQYADYYKKNKLL